MCVYTHTYIYLAFIFFVWLLSCFYLQSENSPNLFAILKKFKAQLVTIEYLGSDSDTWASDWRQQCQVLGRCAGRVSTSGYGHSSQLLFMQALSTCLQRRLGGAWALHTCSHNWLCCFIWLTGSHKWLDWVKGLLNSHKQDQCYIILSEEETF